MQIITRIEAEWWNTAEPKRNTGYNKLKMVVSIKFHEKNA